MNIVEFMKMTFMPATKLSQGFERDFFYGKKWWFVYLF